MEQKIALVTGANRGIGYEVAAQLTNRNFRVFLGARREESGRNAVANLGDRATFLKMDVSEEKSVRSAAVEFGKSADHLDVLVNNAGILLQEDEAILTLLGKTLTATLQTNALGPLLVSQAFEPFLSKSPAPRVINVSSSSGQLTDGADGWAPAYSISKTTLNGITIQLAAARPEWAVNSVCPGWVRTEMGGVNATRSVHQGAAGIVWLATDAPQNLTGKFLRDRKVIPW